MQGQRHEAANGVTIEEYFQEWLKICAWKFLSPLSFDRIEITVSHQITPSIGKMHMTDINTAVCQELIYHLIEDGASYSVVRKTYDAMVACFDYAVRMGDVEENPMSSITCPPQARFMRRASIKNLSEDEEARLLTELSKKWSSSGKPCYSYRDAFVIMLNTGIRREEVVALNWDDIDLVNNMLHVNKTSLCARERDLDGKYIGSVTHIIKEIPDGNALNRKIPINDIAKQAILSLKSSVPSSSYVLRTRTGGRVYETTLSTQLTRAYARSGIVGADISTLRKTYIAHLFSSEVDIRTASKWLGHASTTRTCREYDQIVKNSR